MIIHLSEQMVMFGIRLHVYWILGEDVFRVFYEYFTNILRVFTSILRVLMNILRVFYEYFGPKDVDSYNRVLGVKL